MSILHLPALTTPEQAAQWLRSRASGLQCDSRRLQTGDAFIAWPGAAHDARHHVLPALQNGVAACLAEAAGAEALPLRKPIRVLWLLTRWRSTPGCARPRDLWLPLFTHSLHKKSM